jgi:hypothetical protein
MSVCSIISAATKTSARADSARNRVLLPGLKRKHWIAGIAYAAAGSDICC